MNANQPHFSDHPIIQPSQSGNNVQQAIATTTTTTSIGDKDTFSACLLVMDDNHFLIEWLAYHYHSLPLRYLVIAVDPRSQTSPLPILDRWRGKMNIVAWTDVDFMSTVERDEAENVVRQHFGNLTNDLIRHRARQRLFYDKCMRKLKADGQSWSILTDTDEFLRINVPKVQELQLRSTTRESNGQNQHPLTIEAPASIRSLLQAELQRTGTNLTKSPCIQIPRLRFGATMVGDDGQHNSLPTVLTGFDTTHFLTLHWRKHAGLDQYKINKISKVIIDVSQVPWNELKPVESIHRPIKTLCSQRKLHILSSDSILIINHYLGSWEQYEYRQDARTGDLRSRQQYDKQKTVNAGINDEIRPWLQGFVQTVGKSQAEALLKGVGQLEPKGSAPLATVSLLTPPHEDMNKFMPQSTDNERCAILLFGLPRSFRELVLPSMEKNLIGPNAHYNCDFFVHYFHRTEEPQGRLNKGGAMDPSEILLLEEAVQTAFATDIRKANHQKPVIEFHAETEETFWAARNETVQRYRTTKGADGKYLYFPWKAKSYEYPTSLNNIVKQWHSINGAWDLMEKSAAERGVQYTRVGMFRSDALYVTPVDLYQTEIGTYDAINNQAILAPFGAMPVNDRMFYGPFEAVEIWATQRFSFLESYVHTCIQGWAMHSEKFLDGAILPAIRDLGIAIVVNPDICFLRTRVDLSVLETDCQLSGTTRGFEERDMKSELEKILERKCGDPFRVKMHHRGIRCEPAS